MELTEDQKNEQARLITELGYDAEYIMSLPKLRITGGHLTPEGMAKFKKAWQEMMDANKDARFTKIIQCPENTSE